MSGGLSAAPDLEAQLVLLKRKLKARDKVLLHLEQRLALAPENQHWLFLKDEHEKARTDLKGELQRLELEQQAGAHKLTHLVDHYLSQWEESGEDVFAPGESEAPAPNQALSPEQQHELETWQGLLRKVEARLLRLPGDPRLLALRVSHQARIQALQKGETAQNPDFLPSSLLPEPAAEIQKMPLLKPRTREQIEKELEIWAKLVQKSQARLAAKPELVHLRGMLAEHEGKIAALVAELATLPEQNIPSEQDLTG